MSTYPLEEGVHHTLTVDAQPGRLVTTRNWILTQKYVRTFHFQDSKIASVVWAP